jgi:hypothetical protein
MTVPSTNEVPQQRHAAEHGHVWVTMKAPLAALAPQHGASVEYGDGGLIVGT